MHSHCGSYSAAWNLSMIKPKSHLLWSRLASIVCALLGGSLVGPTWWLSRSTLILPPLFVLMALAYGRNQGLFERLLLHRGSDDDPVARSRATLLRDSRERGSLFFTAYGTIILFLVSGPLVAHAGAPRGQAIFGQVLSGFVSLMLACVIIAALRAYLADGDAVRELSGSVKANVASGDGESDGPRMYIVSDRG